MALSEPTLRDLVISELEVELGKTFTDRQINEITPICTAIARAVINHFTSNAVVSTTVASPIPVQVNTGSGTGGTTAPGSGTGGVS